MSEGQLNLPTVQLIETSALAPLSTLVFGDSIPQITKGELEGYVVSSHKCSGHIHSNSNAVFASIGTQLKERSYLYV